MLKSGDSIGLDWDYWAIISTNEAFKSPLKGRKLAIFSPFDPFRFGGLSLSYNMKRKLCVFIPIECPPTYENILSKKIKHSFVFNSQASQTEAIINTVPETSREASTEDEKDLAEISNLAAQIASFVRTADSDTEKLSHDQSAEHTYHSKTNEQTTANVHTETVHVEVHANVQHEPERFKTPPPPPPKSKSSSRSSSANSRVSPENNEAYPVRSNQTPDRAHSESPARSVPSAASDKQINTLERKVPPKIIIRGATQDRESLDRQPLPTVLAETPISTEVELVLEQTNTVQTAPTVEIVRTIRGPVVQRVESLRITESTEDLVGSKDEPTTPTSADRDRYKIRFIALKPAASDETPEVTSTRSNSSWLHSHASSGNKNLELSIDEDHDYDNVTLRSSGVQAPLAPPKRRRSVKDIIESINKSQRLLRINQVQDPNASVDKRVTSLEQFNQPNSPTSSRSSESIGRYLNELQASEQQMRQTIFEMERVRNDANNNNHSDLDEHDQAVLNNIPVMVERFAEFSDEFKKCNGNGNKKTSSPLLVQRRDKSSRTDWNPLPKPRRSRNLTQEAELAAAGAQGNGQ